MIQLGTLCRSYPQSQCPYETNNSFISSSRQCWSYPNVDRALNRYGNCQGIPSIRLDRVLWERNERRGGEQTLEVGIPPLEMCGTHCPNTAVTRRSSTLRAFGGRLTETRLRNRLRMQRVPPSTAFTTLCRNQARQRSCMVACVLERSRGHAPGHRPGAETFVARWNLKPRKQRPLAAAFGIVSDHLSCAREFQCLLTGTGPSHQSPNADSGSHSDQMTSSGVDTSGIGDSCTSTVGGGE